MHSQYVEQYICNSIYVFTVYICIHYLYYIYYLFILGYSLVFSTL